jgi:TonB-linked SusC/RagA family outer membrane protein
MRHYLPILLLLAFRLPETNAQSGSDKDTLVTAAVSSLESSQFNQGNFSSPVQRFQGKLPGLAVARPGNNPNQGFSMRMRGLSSFQSQVEPLLVLDGMPVSNIDWIDPCDLQSVTLWKDGMAAGRFGMRAGPGVVQVQTLPGAVDKLTIGYMGQLAFEQVAKRYDVLSANEYIKYGGQDLSPGADTNTDWQDLVLQNATSHTHRISLSTPLYGAGSALDAAISYRNLEGILRESGQQQYNGSLRFRQHFRNDKIRLSGAVRAARREADLSFPEAFRYAITFNPSAPVRNDDPQNAPFGGYVTQQLFDYFNPAAIIELNSNRNRLNALMATVRTEVDILTGLTGHLQIGQELQQQKSAAFYSPQSYFRGFLTEGAVEAQQRELRNNFLEAGTRYALQLGSHSKIDISAGYSRQRYDYNATQGGREQTQSFSKAGDLDALYIFALNTGSNYSQGQNTLAAVYGQGRWNLQDKLILEFGMRREGSSRLGRNNKWGNFPYAGMATNFSRIFNWKNIQTLQIRGNYGITGQQPAYDGLSQAVFSASGEWYYYNGNFEPGFFPVFNNNYDLGPEKTGTLNLGLDFISGNRRLKASFDYFQRKSSDLILRAVVPAPPNISNYSILNLGQMESKGWEACIGWQDILGNSRFKWSADLVLNSWEATVVKPLYEEETIFGWIGAPGNGNVGYGLLYPGMPYGQFWGLVRTGVNANGAIQYKDINRDGVVEYWNALTDMTAIGNATPSLMMGLNQSFQWRQLDFNFFLRGIFGHDIAHENRVFYENLDPSIPHYNKVKTGYFNPNIKDVNRLDNTHIEKASFLRLDNLTLGYSIPFKESSRIQKLRLYLSGQNLLTFTDYTGLDPELRLQDPGPSDNGSIGSAVPDFLLPGVDRRGTYFPGKTFIVGVQLQL